MMPKFIFKYALPVEDDATVEMHDGAEILCVQNQREQACIWALVDNRAPVRAYRFAVRGTGHPCKGLSKERYVDTFQLMGGSLVFHVFALD
jgi:hypothetical protein